MKIWLVLRNYTDNAKRERAEKNCILVDIGDEFDRDLHKNILAEYQLPYEKLYQFK